MESTAVFLVLVLFCFGSRNCDQTDKFFYFAYGSNLLAKRILINSPSAELFGVGKLSDYRLDFNMYNDMWHGAVATIVEDPGESAWGALWLLDVKDMANLDRQEGVDRGWYFAKNVTVTTEDAHQIVARTYEQIEKPPKRRQFDDLPFERRPSNTYLEVIVLGAVESALPSDYIGFLMSFPTNGKNAIESLRDTLGYPYGNSSSRLKINLVISITNTTTQF